MFVIGDLCGVVVVAVAVAVAVAVGCGEATLGVCLKE